MKIRNKIISAVLAVVMLMSVMPSLLVGAEAEATSELQNLYYKLAVDGKAKIGYLGGSITEGYLATTPWPTLVGNWLAEKFPSAKITNVNAGIGGTGSMFGAYRAYRDLKMAEAPDLVFIEFAMNDMYLTMTEEQTKRYYESIIQRVYEVNPKCQIISLFTTDWATKGNDCDHKTWQKEIADYYGIKSIEIGKTLWNAVVSENGGTAPTSQQSAAWTKYFNDYVHPKNEGHQVYADEITSYMNEQLLGDTVTRNNTSYTVLKKDATGTNLLTKGNSANFTEAGFYSAYVPGWVLKATNSNTGNITNDLLAWAGNAKLAFEFTGTSAGFYNESIGSDGNLKYKVTKKSDGTVVVPETTVNINGRALTLFADNLPEDTYKVEVTADVNRRFKYVVYSGSKLEICKDTTSNELVAADKVIMSGGSKSDQSANVTETANTSFGGKTTVKYEATNNAWQPKFQRWALSNNGVYLPAYRYVKISYYLATTATAPKIGISFSTSPVDSGSVSVDGQAKQESVDSGIVLANARTNVWTTTVIDLQESAKTLMAGDYKLFPLLRRLWVYPFGDVKGEDLPAGTTLYLESITFCTTYESQEGAVNLSFVSGFENIQGTAPATINSDTSSIITLPVNTFTKEGYTFVGWGINGITYAPGDSFAASAKGNYTANAIWTPQNTSNSKVAYVCTEGYIDSDGNGQPDLTCYDSIDKAYEYFETLNTENDGIIYISGTVVLPNDTSANRGKVTIRGLGDTVADIEKNKLLRNNARIVLQEDLSLDYLTLSDLFGANEGFAPNGHQVVFGEHMRTDGDFELSPAIRTWDNDAQIFKTGAPVFTLNAPNVTYTNVNTARNGNTGTVSGNAKYVFNKGTFKEIVAGSWLWAMNNHSINLNENVDYTFNGGEYKSDIFLGSRLEVGIAGNVVFNINGGTFTNGKKIYFGHYQSGQGYAGYKGVKNAAVIFNNKQIAANGGSVTGVTVDRKTDASAMPVDEGGVALVVINNAEIANGLRLSDNIDTNVRVIKAMNGSAVPVFKDEIGGELLGFRLMADNVKANAVLINDVETTPDTNGLYQITEDAVVSFKQNLIAKVGNTEIAVDENNKLNITVAGTIDLSCADCADSDGKYFIGWKNTSGNYVVNGDTVSVGDVLTAEFIGTDILSISVKAVTSAKSIRYTTTINENVANTLNAMNGKGSGVFNTANCGTLIIKTASLSGELTKDTVGASNFAASVTGNSYYADSEAIADKDLENKLYTARSYLVYTDTLGGTHTIYSEPTDKTMYRAAADSYIDENTSAEDKTELLKILDASPRLGNPFSNTVKKIHRDNELTIGYIGGSITNGYSAGSPAVRVRNNNGTFPIKWADGTAITDDDKNDSRFEPFGGIKDNWGTWNLPGLAYYYDADGNDLTQENALFMDSNGDYFNVIASDISKNWVNRINGWFEESFDGLTVNSVNVGISGTPSAYGAARIKNDLLNSEHGAPDLVFIEFTVNDWLYPNGDDNDNTDGLKQTNEDLQRQVESMILSIWEANPYAEIALIYTAGMSSGTSQQHTVVANHYNLPYSDVGTDLFTLRNARLKKIYPNENRNYENSANKDSYYFSGDNTHPSVIGYGIYFDSIKEDLLDKYITNDMTYGTTLYNYDENKGEPVADWAMLKPTHILAKDFTWTGKKGADMPFTTGMWGITNKGVAWNTTVDCGFDYQVAPGITAPMYMTNRTDNLIDFAETPSTVHITSENATAGFSFTGRAFGFLFKTMYHNIDMRYRVDGGEWKKFRIAADNRFSSNLFENSGFVFAEQNLEQGYHTVELKCVNSGGRISSVGQVTASTNEVNVYLGSAVYFSDTSTVDSQEAQITNVSVTAENKVSVQVVANEFAKVIVSVYDSENKLLSTQFKTISDGNMSFDDITVPQSDGTTVKAMMWDSLDSMTPVCSAKTIVRENGEWN